MEFDIDDFRQIPGFPDYVINCEGKIYNLARDCYQGTHVMQRSPGQTGHAYVKATLKRLDGSLAFTAVHRLLCMAFKPVDGYEHLQVNHIDGNTLNNKLDNLEWCTAQENIHHSGRSKLTRNCAPITIREIDTNTVRHFPTYTAAAEFYAMNRDAIAFRVKNRLGDRRIYPDRRQYRQEFTLSDKLWYTPDDIDAVIKRQSGPDKIVIRNVETGKETTIPSMMEASYYLNISIQTLSARLFRGTIDSIHSGNYQVKYADDPGPFGKAVPYGNRKPVIATNVDTGEEVEYSSANECAAAHNVKKTTMNWRLHTGGEDVEYDGFIFRHKAVS